MDQADLLSLGEHCSVPECRQRDFLPFTCDCCHQVYCLDHRTYETHSCSKAERAESATILCPICARLIKIHDGENANLSFDRHTMEGCDPSNYARVNKKPRCPVKGCKERLTSINTYNCRHCHKDVCLKHRLGTDHLCTAPQGPSGRQGGSVFSRLLQSDSSKASLAQEAGGNTFSSASNLWSRVKDAMPASEAQPKQNGPQSVPQRRKSRPQMTLEGETRQQDETARVESCPICQARFNDVAALIQHCQTHETQQGNEVCPQCNARFQTVVELVAHVERQHASQSTCVLT